MMYTTEIILRKLMHSQREHTYIVLQAEINLGINRLGLSTVRKSMHESQLLLEIKKNPLYLHYFSDTECGTPYGTTLL